MATASISPGRMVSDQQRKDLAEQYRTMMALSAWKHFQQSVLDRIEAQALSDEDSMPVTDINAGFYGECRGRRAAIRKIRSDLEFIINGLR